MNEKLAQIACELRADIMKMYYIAGWGHLAPALSCVDILTALYWGGIIDTENLFAENHDRMILSKGHACAALYAVLARFGYFPRSDLAGFYQKGSPLIGLASSKVNGIDIPTGSLGHGICFATGTALAAKLDHKKYYTYVILGDGESQEGSVWEAAMFAGVHQLNKLIVILDCNRLQASDWVDNITTLGAIKDKWESFGWCTQRVDGHSYDELIAALRRAKEEKFKPTLLIADTIKGKGLPMAENNPSWHSRAPQGSEWEKACSEMGMTMEELKRL